MCIHFALSRRSASVNLAGHHWRGGPRKRIRRKAFGGAWVIVAFFAKFFAELLAFKKRAAHAIEAINMDSEAGPYYFLDLFHARGARNSTELHSEALAEFVSNTNRELDDLSEVVSEPSQVCNGSVSFFFTGEIATGEIWGKANGGAKRALLVRTQRT